MTKPFTITIASAVGLELMQQFLEAVPQDGEKWAAGLKRDCDDLGVECAELDALLDHRRAIARSARKMCASIELGVDVVLDDDDGYMPEATKLTKELAVQLSIAHGKNEKDKIAKAIGMTPEQIDEMSRDILGEADIPPDMRAIIEGVIGGGSESSAEISKGTLDELSSEGKTVIPFPTGGRKDN